MPASCPPLQNVYGSERWKWSHIDCEGLWEQGGKKRKKEKGNRGSEPPKSESVQDSPCGLMWKSTVGQLLRSRCPHIRQWWRSFHFFLTQSDRDNGHFLPNQFSHIPKYSRPRCMSFNVHVANTTWCRYYSFYLQPDSSKDLRLDNVVRPRS